MTSPAESRPGRDYYETVGREVRLLGPEIAADIGYDDPLVRAVGGSALNLGESLHELPTPAEIFMDKFRFVPHSRGEITLANSGLETAVHDSNVYHGLTAVERVETRARGYRNQAMSDIVLLRDALRDHDDPATLDTDEIRREADIKLVVAAHTMFASSLLANKWPAPNQKSRRKRLQPIMADMDRLSDQDISAIFNGAHKSAIERHTFWSGELGKIEQNPQVVMSHRERSDSSRRR